MSLPPETAPAAEPEGDAPSRLKELGESVAGVMHDVGAPLAVILGFAELMADEPDAQARRELLEEVADQVRRITELRDELLAFARGEREVLLRTAHVHELKRDIDRIVTRALAGTPIAGEVTASYLGPVRVDAPQLLRAVENLVQNAREAMAGGRGSRFRVALERDGSELVCTFADDGPGVPEALRDHLFERFATWGKAHGHGLGLAVVQRVAQAHGGTARCFSAPGAGTRFELRLPVLGESAQASAPTVH